ncbi:ABC transporter permease [Allohahella sp. A8]|uniref:ABC transporter permease n=1 Tax=Allohahella sp. A8 TaxID=3141461 RepID=UPI000C08E206|nr:amino acid ABC transporter permease [Hahellaceae bacterium]|tara:strand:- start:44055 stop:44771 length:717 start_codon:yes stop_codon:yes gene_type:complete
MEWLEGLLAGNDIFTLRTLSEYGTGLVNTLQLVVLAVLLGLVMALPLALMRASKRFWISQPVQVFTYVFRGTPLLVQLYIIYYGSSFVLIDTPLWFIFKDAFIPALLAFTLNTAAYTTEIIRGAIVATPAGELEAAKAYGMSYWTRTRCVVLPSAFRRALPAYTNEVIFMLHASAVAFTVTILDLTGAAYLIYSRFYTPFSAFIFVACIYLCLTFTIIMIFRKIEFRMLAHLRPRTET